MFSNTIDDFCKSNFKINRENLQYIPAGSHDRIGVAGDNKNNPAFGVINTDKTGEPGSHWMAYCRLKLEDKIRQKHMMEFTIDPLKEDLQFAKIFEIKPILEQSTKFVKDYDEFCGTYSIGILLGIIPVSFSPSSIMAEKIRELTGIKTYKELPKTVEEFNDRKKRVIEVLRIDPVVTVLSRIIVDF